MPDYRYRQTSVTLDARGYEFRATGRQPLEMGWRDAFPDWRPDDEKDETAQRLPVLRDGEAARLSEPEIEDKETRPPPRYREGTLIEAMQNAWRFVEDEALRDRLREAKGIGTPATRAEIIAGLKRQGFLAVQGKNVVPTERGLALFGVLERADPALVDAGVTAELECLLDDVLTGRQEMMACDRRGVRQRTAHHRQDRCEGRRGRGGDRGGNNRRRQRPAADGENEEVCGIPCEAEGHPATRRLYKVGSGLPGVPRPACAEAGSGTGRGVFRRPGGRRRWSKLDEWLASAKDGSEGAGAGTAVDRRGAVRITAGP